MTNEGAVLDSRDHLLDRLPSAVLVHRAGQVVYANEALAALVGARSPQALHGRPVLDLLEPADATAGSLLTGATGTAPAPGRARLGASGAEVDIRQIGVSLDGEPASLAVLSEPVGARATEEALQASEARFRALVQNASDMVAVHRDGLFTYISPSVTRILGWELAEVVGEPVTKIVHPDDAERLAGRIADRQRGVPSPGPGRYRLLCKGGGWRWVETVSTTHSDDPALQGIVVNARDITVAMEAEEALRRSEERHRALVEHLSDVIIVTDATGRIGYVSPAVFRILGWSPEIVEGQTIFDGMHADDESRGRQRLQEAVTGGPGTYGPERFRYLHADGGWRHLETTATNRLDDPSVGGMVFIVRDVTAQHEAEERLRHLALHDPLTGLANRTLVTTQLRASLAAGRRDGSLTALMVIDLDRFKPVNDALGHEAGDAVLVELAERLSATAREVDTVGRLGGDEFVAVLPSVGSRGEAVTAAQRLGEVLREPVRRDGRVLHLGASIGVAVAPHDGDDVDTLLRHADEAMFRAKAAGLGVCVHGEA